MKKIITTSLVALLVAALAVPAFAWGPDRDRGGGMMGGNDGWGKRWNVSDTDKKFFDDTAKQRDELIKNRRELRDILSAPTVDEAKAKALTAKINKLHNEISEKHLEYELEFKRNNPDYQPRFGGGFDRGRGGGGRGDGPCRD